MRHRIKTYLAAAVVMPVVAASLLVSANAWGTDRDAEAVDGLRVMTYNIHGGRTGDQGPEVPANIARTAVAIDRQNPDIVTVQEIHKSDDEDQTRLLAEALGMYYYFGPADANSIGGIAGNAVLSRFPILERVTKPLPDDPDTNNVKRAMTGVKLDLGDGRIIRVFTTPLSPGMTNPDVVAEREAQARYALDYLSHDDLLLFTGDLNDLPDSKIAQWTAEEGFEDAGAEVADSPTLGDSRIDYIHYRGGLTAESGYVPDLDASDHLPVVIDFSI